MIIILFTEVRDYKSSAQSDGDNYMNAFHPDNTFYITEPKVFTSIGYPYHYYEQEYLWNIALRDKTYIMLIFSNISLHAYKVAIH